MNLNCAILHADPEIAGRLEEYIGKVPFLSLHGKERLKRQKIAK